MPGPTREAVALRYDPQEAGAPVVVAVGTGHQAERMIEAARDNDVPVLPDEDLTHLLVKLSVGDEIPPELYAVVAKVMAFLAELDEGFAARMMPVHERT